jgi:hypothetical protein
MTRSIGGRCTQYIVRRPDLFRMPHSVPGSSPINGTFATYLSNGSPRLITHGLLQAAFIFSGFSVTIPSYTMNHTHCGCDFNFRATIL